MDHGISAVVGRSSPAVSSLSAALHDALCGAFSEELHFLNGGPAEVFEGPCVCLRVLGLAEERQWVHDHFVGLAQVRPGHGNIMITIGLIGCPIYISILCLLLVLSYICRIRCSFDHLGQNRWRYWWILAFWSLSTGGLGVKVYFWTNWSNCLRWLCSTL